MISSFISIEQVKAKIKEELNFTCARLLLDNHPLDDQQIVSATKLKPGTLIRCAMMKQGRQRRMINTGPGSKDRKRIKAQQAALEQEQEQIKEVSFCRSILEAKADLCSMRRLRLLKRMLKKRRLLKRRLSKRRLLKRRSVSNVLFSL